MTNEQSLNYGKEQMYGMNDYNDFRFWKCYNCGIFTPKIWDKLKQYEYRNATKKNII